MSADDKVQGSVDGGVNENMKEKMDDFESEGPNRRRMEGDHMSMLIRCRGSGRIKCKCGCKWKGLQYFSVR